MHTDKGQVGANAQANSLWSIVKHPATAVTVVGGILFCIFRKYILGVFIPGYNSMHDEDDNKFKGMINKKTMPVVLATFFGLFVFRERIMNFVRRLFGSEPKVCSRGRSAASSRHSVSVKTTGGENDLDEDGFQTLIVILLIVVVIGVVFYVVLNKSPEPMGHPAMQHVPDIEEGFRREHGEPNYREAPVGRPPRHRHHRARRNSLSFGRRLGEGNLRPERGRPRPRGFRGFWPNQHGRRNGRRQVR